MSDNDERLDELFRLILTEAEWDGREVHVIELLSCYLKHRPQHGRAWVTYGESLRLLGRYEEAMEALLHALEFAPEDKRPKVLGRIAFLCTVMRSPAEAEDWYRLSCLNKNCTEGWIWLYRGINLMKLGQYEKALTCFDHCNTFDDVDRSEIALNKGLVFRAMQHYEEAIYAFKEAINFDENYNEAKLYLKGMERLDDTRQIAIKLESKILV